MSTMGRADLRALLHRRRWVLIGVFLATVVTHAMFLKTRVVEYETTAMLEVREQRPESFPVDAFAGLDLFESVDFRLLKRIVADPEFSREVGLGLSTRHPSFRAAWTPADFTVEMEPDGRFVVARYRSLERELAPIVDTATVTLCRLAQERFVSAIHGAKTSLEAHLAEQEASRVGLLSEIAGIVDAHDRKGESLEAALVRIERELERVERRVSKCEHERLLTQLEFDLGVVPPDASRDDDADRFYESLTAEWFEKERELRAARRDKSERHPDVIRLSSEVAEARRWAESWPEDASWRAVSRSQEERRTTAARVAARAEKKVALELLEGEAKQLEARRQELLSASTAIRALHSQVAALERRAVAAATQCEKLLTDIGRLDLLAELAPVVVRIERPASATRPLNPPTADYYSMIVLLGCLIAVAAAYAMESIDHRVHDEHVLSRLTDLPLLGVIPMVADAPKKSLDRDVVPPHAEHLTAVVHRLRVQSGGSPILFCGPDIAGGKSFTAAHLALTAGRLGIRTLLIDADLRCPSMRDRFGLPSRIGLAEWTDTDDWERRVEVHMRLHASAAAGESLRVPSDEVPTGLSRDAWGVLPAIGDAPPVQRVRGTTLDVLGAGVSREAPASILDSDRVDALIGWGRGEYELVLIDTPPLAVAADPLFLAGRVGCTILIARAGHTSGQDLKWAHRELSAVGAKLSGVILNGVRGLA